MTFYHVPKALFRRLAEQFFWSKIPLSGLQLNINKKTTSKKYPRSRSCPRSRSRSNISSGFHSIAKTEPHSVLKWPLGVKFKSFLQQKLLSSQGQRSRSNTRGQISDFNFIQSKQKCNICRFLLKHWKKCQNFRHQGQGQIHVFQTKITIKVKVKGQGQSSRSKVKGQGHSTQAKRCYLHEF